MRKFTLITTMLIALSSPLATAEVIPMGGAYGYSGFFFNSFKGTSGDSQRGLASGGDLSVSNFTVNTKFSKQGIVAKGDVFKGGGDIFGDVDVGGKYDYTNGRGIHQGSLTEGSISPIDFDRTYSVISEYSKAMCKEGVSPTSHYGRITLDGNKGNVFNIKSNELSRVWGWSFLNMAPNETVVINVPGKNVNLRSNWWTQNPGNLVFNFYEAKKLKLDGHLFGSVIAPDADVTTNSYLTIDGQFVANSYDGPVQMNDVMISNSVGPEYSGGPTLEQPISDVPIYGAISFLLLVLGFSRAKNPA